MASHNLAPVPQSVEHLQWQVDELDRAVEQQSAGLIQLRQELQTKTPLRLFYTILSTFSALYVAGVVAVYSRVHTNSLEFYRGVAAIQVTQAELKERFVYTTMQGDRMEQELTTMRQNIKETIKELRQELLRVNHK
jgi:hypothetical protein